MAKQRKPAQKNSSLGVQVGKGGRLGVQRVAEATDVAPEVYVNDIEENPAVLEPMDYSSFTEVPTATVSADTSEDTEIAEPVVSEDVAPKLPTSPDAGLGVSEGSPIKAILAARQGATSSRSVNAKDVLSARSSSSKSGVLSPSAVLNARRPGGGGSDPLSVLLNRKMSRGVATKVRS